MGIIDNTVKLANMISEVDNLSLKKDLLYLLEECQNLKQENRSLKEEIINLKEQLEIKESLKFKDNMYWKDSGEGPFCPSCYDSKKQVSNLILKEGKFKYHCPTCKNNFRTSQQEKERSKSRQKMINDMY